MEKVLVHRRLLTLVAMAALTGVALAHAPALAQQTAPNWKAPMATITVTAAPYRNLPEISRMTVQGHKFLAVSASVPVPYSDLDLTGESGAAELGRRIHVAARMACRQLDLKYPQHIYPVIGTDDCQRNAADTGMAEANVVIAAAR